MTIKRSLVWLLLIVWIGSGALPAYALCTCEHEGRADTGGCCAATDAPPAPSACCASGDEAGQAHPCESSVLDQDQDAGDQAVAPRGCSARLDINPVMSSPPVDAAPDLAPVGTPALAPSPGLIPAGTAPPRAVEARLTTGVFRL